MMIKKLWNRSVNGIQIRKPSDISKFSRKINKILIAIPSLSRNKKEIFNFVKNKGIEILQIPSLKEITSGIKITDQLLPIKIEDLLGRDPVSPDPLILGKGINNKVICVTGAGGSIGSELCRKIIIFKPQKLILIDHSEYALFEIERELKTISSKSTKNYCGSWFNI